MDFSVFSKAVVNQFEKMTADDNPLFVTDVDKDEMWNLYLDSFPEGTNPIYRVRREYDCSCCRQFVKNIGNVVAIKQGVLSTIWDIEVSEPAFQTVANTLSTYVKSKTINGIFLTKERYVGQAFTYERLPDGESKKWEHFSVGIPAKYIYNGRDTIDTKRGELRDTRNVFKRSLDEISLDSVDTVLELISQNSLYKGVEWEQVLKSFKMYKMAYEKLNATDKALYAWENSAKAGSVIGRIRNHSIGTLLVNISENMELDEAVRKYEAIIAPANYKRPKAIFTQRMLDDAKKTIEQLGYMDSLKRRYATLDDITINNILFSNRDSAKRINGADDIFVAMSKDTKSSAKKFSKVEKISIEDFITNVLPNTTEVEAYLEGRHIPNMVSLIAPEVKDSKTMFKWNNNFSWAYTGNMTDSMMKERVKSAGGKVDGVLRFSIQWNDGTDYDGNDLDAHCIEPTNEHIYFGHMGSRTGGRLDVDNTHPMHNVPAVENITWPSLNKMLPGKYCFFVNQFCNRGGRKGFRAEIEFNGQIFTYDYPHELRQGEGVEVAVVTLDKYGNFTIEHKLDSSEVSREVWGLNTNQFAPVSVVMYSPNYWDEQSGIGNKHYMFMLKNCKNPEEPNGFYNEFLKQDLDKHKRVFEALGSKLKVNDCDDQLSGIGFSSTQRNKLIVKVKGAIERILEINF